MQIQPLRFFNRKHGYLDMTEFWKPWCPLPPTPISHIPIIIIIIPMHVGSFMPFCNEHTKYVVIELGLLRSQSFTHKQFSLLWNWWPPKCYLSSQTNSTTDAAVTCILFMLVWWVWSSWMSDSFLTAPPAYISTSRWWILMGAFRWYHFFIIRLHFFMT